MFATLEAFTGPLEAMERAGIVAGLLVLLGLLVWLLWRGTSRTKKLLLKRAKHTRLAITDAAAVDENRRLVLVRRDDVEHLVMIGGPSDVVIESDIRRTAPARPLDVTARETSVPPQPVAAPVTAAPVPQPGPLEPPAPAAAKSTPPAPAPMRQEPKLAAVSDEAANTKQANVSPTPGVTAAAGGAASILPLRAEKPASKPETEPSIVSQPPVSAPPAGPSPDAGRPDATVFTAMPELAGNEDKAEPKEPKPSTIPRDTRKISSSVVEEMDALLKEITASR